MIWFTSDLHLSHTNVISMNNRPFRSVQQMNEEIIKRWNKKIAPNDVVYVLGDVCWGWNSQKIKETFSKMNGIKYLIYGNHDRIKNHELANVWAEIVPYKRINIDNESIVLSHYPILDWDRAYHKGYHLYGHCHGMLDLREFTKLMKHNNQRCMDVGVDTHNYYPWSWEEIKEHLNQDEMRTTCDICGKEIVGIQNFVNAGDKVVCSNECLQKAIGEFRHWENTESK